jgi:hypothetical protein
MVDQDNTASATNQGGTTDPSSKFDIPASVRQKYPELIELIMITKSMDDKERQYWFHILPVMNQEQVDKLNTILNNEKNKLAEIKDKYKGSKADEKPDYVPIDEEALKNKMADIKEKEMEHEKLEAQQEADLLAQLENL